MAEENKKVQAACQCGGGMCGCGSCGHAWLRIVRAIFAVIVLIIVFMLGLKIGELRGMLESRHGYRMTGMSAGAYPPMRGGQGFMPGTATSSAR